MWSSNTHSTIYIYIVITIYSWRMCRMCRMCSKTWDAGYEELWVHWICHLFLIVGSFSNCAWYLRLFIMCYFPSGILFPRESRLYINRPLLTQTYARTNSYLYSFVPTPASHWNCLPSILHMHLLHVVFMNLNVVYVITCIGFILLYFINFCLGTWLISLSYFCTHASAKVS